MAFSLGFGKDKEKSSNKTTYTPNTATTSLFNPVFQGAQGLIGQEFDPYAGQLSQGLTADQLGARDAFAPGTGQGATQQAIGAAGGLLDYQPNQITAPGLSAASAGPTSTAGAAGIDRSAVRDLSAGQFAGTDLSAYTNPHEQQVVQATLADIDRQRQIALNNQSGDFTKAGAFGGSRHGIADAETNRGYGDIAARTAAQLRSQGFDTAAGLLTADQNRDLQARSANQAADLNVASQNAGFDQQTGLFNAGAENETGQFNASLDQQTRLQDAANALRAQEANQGAGLSAAQLGLSGAGLLGDLGQQEQAMGLTDVNALNTLGTQQQETEQAALDRQYQQYLLDQGYTQQQIENMTGLLGAIPNLYAGSTQKGKASGTKTGFSAGYTGGG